jgi:hypothetical protein
MSEKLLQEFLIRMNRTRTQVAETKRQCDVLKKEAKKLEKELAASEGERDDLLKIEENLKVQYISTKVLNEEEFDRNNVEHESLVSLRSSKRNRQRESDTLGKEITKLRGEVFNIVKQREQLEGIAQMLSAKLDQASAERLSAEAEARKSSEAYRQMTQTLNSLRQEKETIKKAVVSTFEEELRGYRTARSKQG